MNYQRLSRGMKIFWNAIEFLIEERLSSGQLRLVNKHNQERRVVAERDLVEANFSGNLKVLGFDNENKVLEEKIEYSHVLDFTALDTNDSRKINALRRFEYVKELLSTKKSGFTKHDILLAIENASKKIEDSSPPSTRSVQRWISKFTAIAEDIRLLVDADKAKGNRKRKFSVDSQINLEVVSIIDTCINEVFLTIQQNTRQATFDLVEYRVNKINENRSEGNKIPLPSYKSVCRIISQLDEYEADKARKGRRYANEKHKTLKKGVETTRPLERVECDDTKTDLMVLDPETSLALGRPWLMILIDVFTKMIMGYFLSFYPPSHVTVMMAMKHAIRPKTYVKEKYPDIINTWDTYGLIEVLVVDNAKHWYGKGIEDACYQMGTDIQYAPVRIPWYKPSIERLLKTINNGLIHKQPGTTFSDIFEKGDYDSEKHAVIWLDLLDEILHKWIIDIYSQDLHTGINDIPARRWNNNIVKFPPALPPVHTDLDIIFGKVTYRKLSGTIIHFKNLEYSDSILSTIKTNLKKGEEIKIKYDPTDLGVIYVYDAFWCRFVPVPAVDQTYAKGLTEWQHEVICKFVRRTNQARIDRKALAEAKEYIRQKIADEFGRKPKKLKQANKIAKWMAFEDPTEARIIYHSKSGNKSNKNGDLDKNTNESTTKSLEKQKKFIPVSDELSVPLEFSENETWEAIYADFVEEVK